MKTIPEIVKLQSEVLDNYRANVKEVDVCDHTFGKLADTLRNMLTSEELKMYKEHVAYFKEKLRDEDRCYKLNIHTKKRYARNVKKIVEEREAIEQHGTKCDIITMWGQEDIPHIYTAGEDNGTV